MIELVVAMGIFSLVCAAFLSALVVLARTVTTSRQVTDNTERLRTVAYTLGRSISGAARVNPPAQAGTSHYLEFRVDVVGAGNVPYCVQWRYQAQTGRLEERRWLTTGATVQDWRLLADHVVNDPVTQVPFRLDLPDGVRSLPRVTVDLSLAEPRGPVSSGSSSYLVRNYDPEHATPDCLDRGRP